MAWDRWDKQLIINVSLWETYSSSFANLVKFGVVSRRGEVLDTFSQWRAKSLLFLFLDAGKWVEILLKSFEVVIQREKKKKGGMAEIS